MHATLYFLFSLNNDGASGTIMGGNMFKEETRGCDREYGEEVGERLAHADGTGDDDVGTEGGGDRGEGGSLDGSKSGVGGGEDSDFEDGSNGDYSPDRWIVGLDCWGRWGWRYRIAQFGICFGRLV